MNTITIQFLGRPRKLHVSFAQYKNGKRAVLLDDDHHGEPGESFCVVSVNMPDATERLPHDVFYVKNWGGQEAVVEELLRLGYLEQAEGIPPAFSGYVQAEAYRWNENPQPAERSLSA